MTGLLNDGSKTFIEALEYEKSYNSVNANHRVFKGTDEISIFPATIKEIEEHFESAIDSIAKSVEDDKKKLADKIEALEAAKQFVAGELSKTLSEVSYMEVSQAQYDEQKRLKEEQLKQLQN